MRTEDLIARLGDEATPVAAGFVGRRLALAVLGGVVLAAAACAAVLGVRPDFADAVGASFFWVKAGYTAALAVVGYFVVERLSRPGVEARAAAAWLAVPIGVLAVLAVVQTVAAPPEAREAMFWGRSWRQCPVNILFLTALVLPGVLWMMRSFAPTRPALAGAGAGLLAGATAATAYGLHCPESTAAFVVVWYTLGVALAGLAGALLGRFVLRW